MSRKKKSTKSRIYSIQRSAHKKKKKHKEWLKAKRRNESKFQSQVSKEVNRNIKKARHKKLPFVVKAPENFSLINNANSLLNFFYNVHQYLLKRVEILLDFSEIQKVTPDAIIILLAKLSNTTWCNNMPVFGKKPLDPELDKIFFESGFYKVIGIDKKAPTQGLIHTKKNTIVDRAVAVEARKLASNGTFNCDKKVQPLYRTLIECMANTKKHAKGDNYRDETWWLAVFNNPETKITSFSFIDTGIGILKSARIKKITKFAVKLGIKSNTEILKDVLHGKIESSTGLHYRGRGLPKIFSDFNNKHLHRLFIISNDVYANLEDGIFVELDKPLNGTFLYWEIIPESNNKVNNELSN